MLEAGESVVTVARWLGHSSPAVTLGYYALFMPEAGTKGAPSSTDCLPVETPQILPRADRGRFPRLYGAGLVRGLPGSGAV
ncbi:hypothetical protein [Streptomyces sp. NPDC059909]|uniref:hypothetical protein n=1 Tax=Streptomyces sp. NPDC059909 TaxID=3346998 RepID=UPI00364C1841